jgi:Ca2+-binding EF-hand superfamily protein
MEFNKRSGVRQTKTEFARKIMNVYNVSKTGSLNREEVHAMCLGIVEEVAPLVQVLESDIDIIMRVGGNTAKAEITVEEIPEALSAVLALKSENIFIHELFVKYDTDKLGWLHKDQLKSLLTELTEGVIPDDNDLEFIIKQCDVSGGDTIEESEIKAAIMSWYCLAEEETPMPTSIEEAKTSGYDDEQIEMFLKAAKEAGYKDDQIAEFMKARGIKPKSSSHKEISTEDEKVHVNDKQPSDAPVVGVSEVPADETEVAAAEGQAPAVSE